MRGLRIIRSMSRTSLSSHLMRTSHGFYRRSLKCCIHISAFDHVRQGKMCSISLNYYYFFFFYCVRRKGERRSNEYWIEIYGTTGLGRKIGLPAAGAKTNDIIAKARTHNAVLVSWSLVPFLVVMIMGNANQRKRGLFRLDAWWMCFCYTTMTMDSLYVHEHHFEWPWLWDVNRGHNYISLECILIAFID